MPCNNNEKKTTEKKKNSKYQIPKTKYLMKKIYK